MPAIIQSADAYAKSINVNSGLMRWSSLRALIYLTLVSFTSMFSGLMSLCVIPSLFSSLTVVKSCFASERTLLIAKGRFRESAN